MNPVSTRILERIKASGVELATSEKVALEEVYAARVSAVLAEQHPDEGHVVPPSTHPKSEASPDPVVRQVWAEITAEAAQRRRRIKSTLELFTYSRDFHALEDARIDRCGDCGTWRLDSWCATCAVAIERSLRRAA